MIGIQAINVTQALLKQICDIDEFKGLWRGLDKHTTGLHLLADVADYGGDFKQLLAPLQEKPITIETICVLHMALTRGKTISELRTEPYSLPIPTESGIAGMLEPADPPDIKPVLSKLLQWANDAIDAKDTHPLLIVGVFSAVFLQICPFAGANMNVLRMLITLLLLKSGYAYAPYISLGPLLEADGAQLFKALSHTQSSLEEGRADWSVWLPFFLGILQTQKDILYQRLNGKEKEISNLPALSAKIMALFTDHPRLQMKQIIKLTNGRRATIKLRLNELVEGGYLKRHGQARATWYALI